MSVLLFINTFDQEITLSEHKVQTKNHIIRCYVVFDVLLITSCPRSMNHEVRQLELVYLGKKFENLVISSAELDKEDLAVVMFNPILKIIALKRK